MWDVDGMMEAMPYRQLREWQAYMHVDPFGEDRADLRAALVRQAIINTMGRGEGDDPVSVRDCMPRFGETTAQKRKRQKQQQREIPRKVQEVLGKF